MRCAGCVWLVSLVSFSRSSPAITARLLDIQEAFGGLLGDSGELTQELASRGLSLAYRLGTPETQKALLDNLVGSLQGAPHPGAGVSRVQQPCICEQVGVQRPGVREQCPGCQ